MRHPAAKKYRERTPDAETLAARLERGWQMVESARAAGNDDEADRLEDHWIKLLQEYESLYDDMEVS